MDYARELQRYKQQLLIDKDNLDGELVHQSAYYFAVSEILTQARAERDASKTEMDEVLGEVKADLFHNDPKLADTKATAMAKADPDYIKAVDAKVDMDRIVGQWEAMQEAVKSRGYMLRQLADLYVANYYSPTSAGESAQEKRQKAASRRERSEQAPAPRSRTRGRGRGD